MKKFVTLFILFFISVSISAQHDVVKFLGFDVDGSKSDMVQNLKSKDFVAKYYDDDTEYFVGRFNGNKVHLYILSESGKVSRIALHDEDLLNETDIKIRFNRLCRQFKDNGKYWVLDDYTIGDDEDISYQISVKNKRYEAVFYQLPNKETKDSIGYSATEKVMSKYTPDEYELCKDQIREEIAEETYSAIYEAIKNKIVWFKISEHHGKYYISMFYDNEYNRPHGQDL